MPNYVLTFHGEMGSMPEDPAAMEAVMAEWGAWYGSMGDSLVDGGAPFGETTAIAPDGSTTANPASLTGYTIIKADDLGTATAIAKDCPVLKNGHTVQISQSIDM
ncbi:MAG: YciI family protein [Acidimicrobiia bacterium]|nr:YciI family protein [Acidimicrobiia bacterium]